MLESWRMARRPSRAGRDERRRQRRLSQRRRRVLRLIRDRRRHYSDANTYSHGARSIGSSGWLLAIGMMDEPIRPAINTESRFLDTPWTLLNLGILCCSSLSLEMVCLDLIQMPWNILLQYNPVPLLADVKLEKTSELIGRYRRHTMAVCHPRHISRSQALFHMFSARSEEYGFIQVK